MIVKETVNLSIIFNNREVKLIKLQAKVISFFACDKIGVNNLEEKSFDEEKKYKFSIQTFASWLLPENR